MVSIARLRMKYVGLYQCASPAAGKTPSDRGSGILELGQRLRSTGATQSLTPASTPPSTGEDAPRQPQQAIMTTAASDDVALTLDAQTPPASARSDMSADNAFFTAGCAPSMREMPKAHENSGLRNLVSFDDLNDDQILNYSDLERLDELRDKIRHRGVERKNRFWWCMLRGTAIFDVMRHPVFVLCYAVYGIMLWWYKRPDDSDAKVYGLVLTVLGGSLSFATIFLNSETYQRFRISYLASCKCQGCIFNTATLARASLRDVVARTVVRYTRF